VQLSISAATQEYKNKVNPHRTKQQKGNRVGKGEYAWLTVNRL
jgi:hypothetical protein